jgi:hypothetical protein
LHRGYFLRAAAFIASTIAFVSTDTVVTLAGRLIAETSLFVRSAH